MYSERIDKSLILLGAERLIEWEELLAHFRSKQQSILINLSNHPSKGWNDQQKFGFEKIIDIPFPEIQIDSNFDMVADSMYDRIRSNGCNPSNSTIMVQGQHPATFSIVACFINAGWTVLSAFTERICTDNPDGTRTYAFQFGGYQRYWSRYVQQDFLENLFKTHFGDEALL